MRILGELGLLASFVGSGFAAFACLAGGRDGHRLLRTVGRTVAVASVLALTMVLLVLARALLTKDFEFAYVAQYSSKLLPWHYSLSALWVGQAGSILCWAWLLGMLSLVFRFWPQKQPSTLREPAFGVLMAYLCFLTAIMVFAADPMTESVSRPHDGAGLSPLLQHPAMLIHPPFVLLAYAIWAIPFALVAVALVYRQLDTNVVRQVRPWALMAWTTLGAGILLGAQWAYEELGWGGYWAWDPVENGSLMPWLTGTALIHTLMAWQYRGVLKKTAVVLAIATFGLCNFATFLTRSGIFSSLHAFSKSPVGWLFLVLMLGLVAGGGYCVVARRASLAPEKPIGSAISCEGFAMIAALALSLLSLVIIVGTTATAVSSAIYGRSILVGPAFYNNVLIPTGLVLLTTTAMAPLLRWGKPPTADQRKCLLTSLCAGGSAAALTKAMGFGHPLTLAVAGLSVLAMVALLSALAIDSRQHASRRVGFGVFTALRRGRRRYAGFVVHMGFVCLAIGVTGSSLGRREQEFVMREGETVEWTGRSVRLARIMQRKMADKWVADVELEISQGSHQVATVRPAQHFHVLQEAWTTEVAIHSTWSGDFYTILHRGAGPGQARLTFVENPMMRWMWFGAWLMGLGAAVRLWPTRQRSAAIALVAVDAEATNHRATLRRAAAAGLLATLTLHGTLPSTPQMQNAPEGGFVELTTVF